MPTTTPSTKVICNILEKRGYVFDFVRLVLNLCLSVCGITAKVIVEFSRGVKKLARWTASDQSVSFRDNPRVYTLLIKVRKTTSFVDIE